MKLPELTDSEYHHLLLILGYAAGASVKNKSHGMSRIIVELTNKLCMNIPEFVPLEIAADGEIRRAAVAVADEKEKE